MLIFERNFVGDWKKIIGIFCNMAKKLNEKYIYELFATDHEIIMYSLDDSVDAENCPCGLIYKIEKIKGKTTIYIMFVATQYRFRKFGYASIFMNEFIDYLKSEYTNATIVLDSVESAVTFYERLGFQWTFDKKYDEIFDIDEDNMHEHIIMCKSF